MRAQNLTQCIVEQVSGGVVAGDCLAGLSVETIYKETKIDPWFLRQIRDIVDMENEIRDISA